MKKIQLFITAIVVLTFCSTVLGQAKKIQAGVELGPTLGLLRGNFLADITDPAIRYSGGLSLQYNFNGSLSFRTGLAYERKSVVAKIQFIDQNRNSTNDKVRSYSHFDYLTLPFLARLSFGDNARYFVNAGPYVGYLIKAIEKGNVPTPTGVSKGSMDYTFGYNRFDAGLTTGLGVLLPLSEDLMLSIEGRNNLGLYRIDKQMTGGVIDRNNRINSTSLLFGLTYPL